ncbi:MAG: hypothetical protein PHG49_00825 [Candidatus Pacebacteria bacterium]|nr:hypothetical protein [Candidatus Paceibacterota bacterium]
MSTENWTITPTYRNKIGIYPFEDYPEYTYTRNVYEYTDINYENNTIDLKYEYSGEDLLIGTKVAQNHGTIGTYMYSFSTSSLPTE